MIMASLRNPIIIDELNFSVKAGNLSRRMEHPKTLNEVTRIKQKSTIGCILLATCTQNIYYNRCKENTVPKIERPSAHTTLCLRYNSTLCTSAFYQGHALIIEVNGSEILRNVRLSNYLHRDSLGQLVIALSFSFSNEGFSS